MSQETTAACCKVGRAIDSYDLFEFDAELRTRRQRGDSLRDLATFTNTRILERALTTTDADVVGDSETLYRILTDAEIRQSRRTEVESKLETHGVNLDRLQRNFVSHTTMRQHLQGCLDIDTSRDQNVDPDAERGTIEWARARSEQVIEESLSRLNSAGDLETGPLEVTHSVRVTCDACGESYRLHELLDTGRCSCAHERD